MDKRFIIAGPSSAEVAKSITRDGAPELMGFSKSLQAYEESQTAAREQAEQRRQLRQAASRELVKGFREQFGRDPDYNELRAGVAYVVKSLAADDPAKGKPTLAEIMNASDPRHWTYFMRDFGRNEQAIADAKKRKGGEQKEQAPEPPRPRYSFTPAYGMLVEGKLPDGRKAHGKILDWGVAGVTAVVNDQGDYPQVKIPWADVRPIGPNEQERLRREQAEREDRDQEKAGVVTSKYTAEDLVRGMRITCLDDDEEPVTGRIASVEPCGPHAHVTLRVHENGRSKLRAFEIHEVVQAHEEEES